MESDWKDWQKTRAYGRLKELARKPYDLTMADALTKDGRLRSSICRTDLLSLFYASQRVDDQVLDCLQELAGECELVAQFAAMRRGAVMNRIQGFESENRQVLHTACRDLFRMRRRNRRHPPRPARRLESFSCFSGSWRTEPCAMRRGKHSPQ